MSPHHRTKSPVHARGHAHAVALTRVAPCAALCVVALCTLLGITACDTTEERAIGTDTRQTDADAHPDTTDAASADTADAIGVDTTDTDSSSCSSAGTPTPNGACTTAGLTCSVGEECCCGSCYDSLVCTCEGGTWACYYTDACMIPACPTECTTIDAEHDALLAAATSCSVDADCQVVDDHCGVGLGGCYAYVNQSFDTATFDGLASQWTMSGCMEGAAVCDCAIAEPAGCNAGTCGAKTASSGPCTSNDGCTTDEYCDFQSDFCGATGFMQGQGSCALRPESCDAGGTGVCACDGATWTNACEAATSGQDITRFGGCAVSAGGFDCGGLEVCTAGQYCAISMNDVPGPEYFASCVDFPTTCGTDNSCACLPADDFATCSATTGFVVVVYPGG